jgi:hypothetical protein
MGDSCTHSGLACRPDADAAIAAYEGQGPGRRGAANIAIGRKLMQQSVAHLGALRHAELSLRQSARVDNYLRRPTA